MIESIPSDSDNDASNPGVKLSMNSRIQSHSSSNMLGILSSSSDASDESSTSSSDEVSNKSQLESISQVDGDVVQEVKGARINDTRRTRMFRILVIILFVCMAVAVTLAIFLITRSNEVNNFEASFVALSGKVIDKINFRLEQKFSAIDSLGIAVTSYVTNSKLNRNNDSWPFITVPDFQLRGENACNMGDVLSVGIHPLVDFSQRETWEKYIDQNIDWLRQSERRCGLGAGKEPKYSEQILRLDSNTGFNVDESPGPYLPYWQITPANDNIINFNILSHPIFSSAAEKIMATGEAVISQLENTEKLGESAGALITNYYGCLMKKHLKDQNAEYQGQPLATIFYPIFNTLEKETRTLVGMFAATLSFEKLFVGSLPVGSGGILCVIHNECGDTFSFEINGQEALYLGPGDLHNVEYDSLEVQSYEFASVGSPTSLSVEINSDYCPYSLQVYPQDELHDQYVTDNPMIYAIIVAMVALFVLFVALIYDIYLQRRMKLVLKTAESSRAIVLRDDVYHRRNSTGSRESKRSRRGSLCSIELTSRPGSNENASLVQDIMQPLTKMVAEFAAMAPAKMRLKFFLHEEDMKYTNSHQTKSVDREDETLDPSCQPIADLYPHCTVLFADIEEFTVWSSEREPEQVFTLLQTIFHAFDRIARKRDVFKVETTGDCYIAVTGLPDPQSDHAVRMIRFARSCLKEVNEITKKLEVTLGPGTGNLSMRFGIHSGPVTAGVLRGQKARLQLFGDTVNLASKMEHTGKAGRIQISVTTAHLLIDAAKQNWIIPRTIPVEDTKNHASIQTYWVLTRRQNAPSMDAIENNYRPKSIPVTTIKDCDSDVESLSGNGSVWRDDTEWNDSNDILENTDQVDRQIEWQVDLLARLLTQIAAGRDTANGEKFLPSDILERKGTILEEISERIELPKFDPKSAKALASQTMVELPEQVIIELRKFVINVASRYRKNPFHNFGHAIHVTMSANKLLSRMAKPECLNYHRESVFAIASDLHDYTYGITSDPLTHFAIMFSTLIHDVDHTGVSNGQRNKEEPALAQKYKMRSVAEQNSVDIAWDLLMDDDVRNLRKFILSTEAELVRFRQLLVNLVMATDIFEKEMKSIRDMRWEKVFHSDLQESLEDSEFRNLKATIVIEHIIQAADVAHTMQHWKVYTKWNENLFEERYMAYKDGRSTNDPSEGWYNGELWFL
jgi:class 3 adenylate cyclase